jgi:hypothetical protein
VWQPQRTRTTTLLLDVWSIHSHSKCWLLGTFYMVVLVALLLPKENTLYQVTWQPRLSRGRTSQTEDINSSLHRVQENSSCPRECNDQSTNLESFACMFRSWTFIEIFLLQQKHFGLDLNTTVWQHASMILNMKTWFSKITFPACKPGGHKVKNVLLYSA